MAAGADGGKADAATLVALQFVFWFCPRRVTGRGSSVKTTVFLATTNPCFPASAKEMLADWLPVGMTRIWMLVMPQLGNFGFQLKTISWLEGRCALGEDSKVALNHQSARAAACTVACHGLGLPPSAFVGKCFHFAGSCP